MSTYLDFTRVNIKIPPYATRKIHEELWISELICGDHSASGRSRVESIYNLKLKLNEVYSVSY